MSNVPPSERWADLKSKYPNPRLVQDVAFIHGQIEAIDRDTEWQAVEPSWWLEMMNYSRQLFWGENSENNQ